MPPAPPPTPQTNQPAPLRRRRRRRGLPYGLRLAGVAAVGLLSALILFQVTRKVIRPYQLGYTESRKVAVLREQLATENRRNDALRQKVAYLQTAEGAESEARRARPGWHRPGEVVYLLDDPEASPAPPSAH